MLSLLIQHIVIKVLSFSTLSHQYPVLDQQIRVKIHSFNTQTSCFSNPSVRPYLHWIQCTTCPTTYRDCLGIFATLLCQCQILTLWPNLVPSANLFNVSIKVINKNYECKRSQHRPLGYLLTQSSSSLVGHKAARTISTPEIPLTKLRTTLRRIHLVQYLSTLHSTTQPFRDIKYQLFFLWMLKNCIVHYLYRT